MRTTNLILTLDKKTKLVLQTDSGERIEILLSNKQVSQASISIRAPENVQIARKSLIASNKLTKGA
jgi:hypothetical protein